MTLTTAEFARDYGWPSIRLAAGLTELVLVPSIGGRLMGIRHRGNELLFANPELLGARPDLEALRAGEVPRGHTRFPLWGGEKTWVAPQSAWPNACPPPDLDSGPYEAEVFNGGHAVTLRSSICTATQLQIERTITVIGEGKWETRHVIHNRGQRASFVGPWSVMMVKHPCLVALPAVGEPVPMSGDAEPFLARLGRFMTIQCNVLSRFKTGHHLSTGWIGTFVPVTTGAALLTSRWDAAAASAWAHGHPAEVFNSVDYPYCEVEIHGPAEHVPPGCSLELEVTSQLVDLATMPNSEEEFDQAMSSTGGL